MADITTTSDEHWTVSSAVSPDKVDITVNGDPADVESVIEDATRVVQSWWQDATGKDYPSELPDPSTVADGGDNDLLGEATAYLAASMEHEKRTDNVRSSQGGAEGAQAESRYVFLEHRAEQLFDAWVSLNGWDDPEGPGGGDEIGTPEVGVGRIDSLIDLPEDT